MVVSPEGGLLTRMPPQAVDPPNAPGPFPVTVVFLMSNAAPFSRMPPPWLLVTAQVSMWRVTELPLVGDAFTPIPVTVPP